jgi:DNA-binding NtrC family response regulator
VTQQQISVLVIGDRYLYCGEIENQLSHTRWRVCTAHSIEDAKRMMKRQPIQVVLCQHTLRDGTWTDALKAAGQCDPPAQLIVLAKADDRLWAEVLTMGGYDLLPVPCAPSELYSLVPEAWRQCVQREHTYAAAV